ncbi:TetR/AcrR family transcriptional regulator [Kribbella sp. CA-293567]|uniref:TetR/AcrR family transcriptional regulator n=1 Tax=Kribbella sp. CA-293567 TaxID=3002436 RepID=UPI0022DE930B|nr:TetR family transcriptional regulator [Kribbella sp. CA-293567]WBQ06586.1 TetR family transcriptional regulator [Kribbella sp. CA-293567]
MDSFAERTKRRLRDELLDSAYDAVVAGGYDGLRMADVGRRTGVSRQTVYNEFGDKWGVLQAVAVRETERFLVDVNDALAAHPDPIDGLRAAVERALSLASDNPLVKAALSQPGSDQASQLLTTRGQQVLELCHQRLDAHVREHWPAVPADDSATCVDVALRLVLSHIVNPGAAPAVVADQVARVLGPFLTTRR